MSKVLLLRALVEQRLTAAAEEIFGVFERTIAEYEEELCRSKEENERQQKLLDAVFKPQLRLHRSDVQQLLVCKEEVPPKQQERSSSLDQEDPPHQPHINEEERELWTNQEGEQIQGLEEADFTKSMFTPVPVKREDEERPQSSELHHRQSEEIEIEADGEDCGGPDPAKNSEPERLSQCETDEQTEVSSDDDDWEQTRGAPSGFRRPSDVQQLLVCKEEVPPEQQERSSSLDQEDPPQPPHVKEEEEELWTNQEGEQIQGLEEADVKSMFTPVPVKREDEERPESSELHHRQSEQMEIEADEEDCGGPEPAKTSEPERLSQCETDEQTEESSDPETDVSDEDWEQTTKGPSGFQGPSDIQQLLVCKEEVPPEQQERSSSLDHEDPPQPPHIKQEEEELWTNQEGEQLQGLEEADVKSMFTPVPVKREDEERSQSSELHHRQSEHMQIEADGEDCGGPEPAKNSEPERLSQCETDEQTEVSSDPETDVSDEDWEQTRGAPSGFRRPSGTNRVYLPEIDSTECGKRNQNSDLKQHMRLDTGEKPFSCFECGKCFNTNSRLRRHLGIHTGEKTFSCSQCGKCFHQTSALKTHMRIHTGDKPFSCSECGKCFNQTSALKTHMSIHTGEKTFSCSECGKCFNQSTYLKKHMRVHTGEKPFSCSECGKCFNQNSTLKKHMRVHTGEKPFSCSECGKCFNQSGDLKSHMRIHTGEKPFSCSVCTKRFCRKSNLLSHFKRHTGEKPHNCSICGQRFSWPYQLKRHECGGHQSFQVHQRQTEQMGTGAERTVEDQNRELESL